MLSAVKEQIENGKKLIAGWAEEKPWITEEETKGATDKVRGLLPGQFICCFSCMLGLDEFDGCRFVSLGKAVTKH